MTVEKPKPKQLLRPITTGAGSAMNQSQFVAITWNSLEARENHAYVVGLVLGLFLIDWKTGASLLSQSLSVAIAITIHFRQSCETALYKKKTKVKKTDAGLEWPISWRTKTLCLTPVLPRPFFSHAVERYISQTVLFARSIVRNDIFMVADLLYHAAIGVVTAEPAAKLPLCAAAPRRG